MLDGLFRPFLARLYTIARNQPTGISQADLDQAVLEAMLEDVGEQGDVVLEVVFGEGQGDTGRLFVPVQLAEAPPWIPYLPIPGTYTHPQWGTFEYTKERLARFVANFNSAVYQSQVPLDAEHQTKLSGAVGWIKKLRQNADGSVDAKVEWTDRGRELLQQDRFKYVSAEYYDEWTSPTGETFQDVVIGGAICTRPFFKESALRPLAASEPGEEPITSPEEGTMSDESPEPNAASEPIQMAELQRQLSEERAAREKAEKESKSFAERIERIEADNRRKAFTAEVMGKSDDNGIRWYGEVDKHVSHLEKLATTFGEDSDEVKHYRDLNRAHAKQIKEAGIFSEIGVGGSPDPSSASGELDAAVKKYREANPTATEAQAVAAVGAANPELVRKSRQEGR